MQRLITGLIAAVVVVGAIATASAQTPASTGQPKMKLTRHTLKEMREKWSANKGKLKACRKEVKSRGLAGDDRWFYIGDCMSKS
jgi:Ni/Co efflux regulator RcnB